MGPDRRFPAVLAVCDHLARRIVAQSAATLDLDDVTAIAREQGLRLFGEAPGDMPVLDFRRLLELRTRGELIEQARAQFPSPRRPREDD